MTRVLTCIGGLAAVLTLACLHAGCSDNDDDGGSDGVGSGGGTVMAVEGQVTVPPDALDSETDITVAAGSSLNLSNFPVPVTSAGDPVELGPSGTEFRIPVEVQIPYTLPGGASTGDVMVGHHSSATGEYELRPPEAVTSTEVTVLVDSFSTVEPVVVAAETPVGSWGTGVVGSNPGEVFMLTFFPNGTYLQYQNGDGANPTEIGVEYGTWSVDAAGTPTFTPILDQNGSVGLYDSTGGGQTITNVSVSGDTLSVTESGVTGTLSRVVDAAQPIVGAYGDGVTGTGPGEIFVTVMYPNGSYIMWQNGDDLNPNEIGVDYGTYTFAGGQLQTTSIFDENGSIGFTDDGQGQTFAIDLGSVGSDYITFDDGVEIDSFLRVR